MLDFVLVDDQSHTGYQANPEAHGKHSDEGEEEDHGWTPSSRPWLDGV